MIAQQEIDTVVVIWNITKSIDLLTFVHCCSYLQYDLYDRESWCQVTARVKLTLSKIERRSTEVCSYTIHMLHVLFEKRDDHCIRFGSQMGSSIMSLKASC